MTRDPDQTARRWLEEMAGTLTASLPPNFSFVLAIYEPDQPHGALMLSPYGPEIVAPLLRQLADACENRPPDFSFQTPGKTVN